MFKLATLVFAFKSIKFCSISPVSLGSLGFTSGYNLGSVKNYLLMTNFSLVPETPTERNIIRDSTTTATIAYTYHFTVLVSSFIFKPVY